MSSNRKEDCGLHNVVSFGFAICETDPLNSREGQVVPSFWLGRPNWDDDDNDEPWDDDDDDDAFDEEEDDDDDLDDEDDDDHLDA